MAVYRDLRILTGRPGEVDLRRAPHALFGAIDGAERYSVGRWLADVEPVLRDAWAAGRLPILVGGTGLYFQALTQGLSEIPAVSEAVRARVKAEARNLPPEALHLALARRDPETAARLRPTDPQRILRALEVFEETGRPLAMFQARRGPPLLAEEHVTGTVLAPDRLTSMRAIDRRFDAMMARGALGEVEALATRGLDPALPVMRALGVPPLLAHLRDRVPLEEAMASAKAQTRAYAKRQLTFARHQLRGFRWLAPQDAEAAIVGSQRRQ